MRPQLIPATLVEGAAAVGSADGGALGVGDGVTVALDSGECEALADAGSVRVEVGVLVGSTRGAWFLSEVISKSPPPASPTPAMPSAAQPNAWRAGSAKNVRMPWNTGPPALRKGTAAVRFGQCRESAPRGGLTRFLYEENLASGDRRVFPERRKVNLRWVRWPPDVRRRPPCDCESSASPLPQT